ncbi:MAG: M56 family metallopeptidase, partial [Thermocrispum sp.]
AVAMSFLRRNRAGLMVVGLLAGLRVLWRPPGPIRDDMTLGECLSVAALVVLAVGSALIVARAVTLAIRARAAVRRAVTTDTPPGLATAASDVGVRRVTCLADADVVAFCAGVFWPRVFVSTGAVHAYARAELDAVLAHEAAHASRHDPLRRLLARASSEVLFFVPLCDWWATRRMEHAELSADRAAIRLRGAGPLARALSIAGDGSRAPAGTPGFDGAAQARVAQLLGDPVRPRRPSRSAIGLSLIGLVLAVSLAMCVGQGAVAAVGG